MQYRVDVIDFIDEAEAIGTDEDTGGEVSNYGAGFQKTPKRCCNRGRG